MITIWLTVQNVFSACQMRKMALVMKNVIFSYNGGLLTKSQETWHAVYKVAFYLVGLYLSSESYFHIIRAPHSTSSRVCY